jgi:hypothetical protein
VLDTVKYPDTFDTGVDGWDQVCAFTLVVPRRSLLSTNEVPEIPAGELNLCFTKVLPKFPPIVYSESDAISVVRGSCTETALCITSFSRLEIECCL